MVEISQNHRKGECKVKVKEFRKYAPKDDNFLVCLWYDMRQCITLKDYKSMSGKGWENRIGKWYAKFENSELDIVALSNLIPQRICQAQWGIDDAEKWNNEELKNIEIRIQECYQELQITLLTIPLDPQRTK